MRYAAGASGGGGIGHVVELLNSTVTGNTALSQGGINAGQPTIANSIVLGNSSDEINFDINVQQQVNYSGLNIVGTGTDTDASDGRINADPTKVFAQTCAAIFCLLKPYEQTRALASQTVEKGQKQP